MAATFVRLSLLTVCLASQDEHIHESKGSCALQTKMSKGGAGHMSTCGMEEVMCHDPMTGTSSCHPKSTGCPVTCAAGENMCHSPPPCPTCDAYNWCSTVTCPIVCGTNEVLCHDSTTMTDTCHPSSTGCPVTCPPGDNVCHMPPTCDTCQGSSWCSSSPCPVYCTMNETMCHDSTTMTDSCHPKSSGCPVTCAPGDNMCHTPPSCDGCDGYNWCSPTSCPVVCSTDEVLCHDSSTMTDSCHPSSTGCPVTCAPGENMCHTPPSCSTCYGYNWCSTAQCPLTCGTDEVVCHDSTTMTDSCHPISTGCPVTCAPGDHVCHTPPSCNGCHGYSWCSSTPCPP